MVFWVIGSIPLGGPIELYFRFRQCTITGITKAVICAILCAYKIFLAALVVGGRV